MQAKENWYEKLRSIDMVYNAGLLDWQPLYSGTSNHVFKIKTEVGTWVVRFNRAALGIDRLKEKEVMALVEPLKLGPKVIVNDPEKGFLVTEYIDRPPWRVNDFKDTTQLKRLKKRLNQLHSIPYEHLPSRLDYRLKLYIKTIQGISASASLKLLTSIQKLEFLGFWEANKSLYHSDLNPNNILGHDKISIVDWEFAGQGHPLLDWLIIEYETKIDLSAYFPQDINPVWVEPARQMIRGMMNLWPYESP